MLTAHETLDQPVRTKLSRFMAAAIVAGVVLATVPTFMTCGSSTLLEVAATARQTHGVHLALLGIGTALALGVCGMLLYSISTFRASGQAESAGVRRAVRETVWALVPIAILFGAATPAIQAFVAADTPVAAQNPPVAGHRCQSAPF